MSNGKSTATAGPAAPRIAVRPYDDPTYDVDPGRGWVLFAGIMTAFVGVLNVIYGIAAVSDSKFFVRDVAFVIGSLHLWGWFLIVVGAVQLCVAVGIWRATEWGRWLGILSAATNGFIQFLVMPAYPLWAVMVLMVDVIIVFGLLTYGGRDRDSLAG
jgi:uncharacterized membrane protein